MAYTPMDKQIDSLDWSAFSSGKSTKEILDDFYKANRNKMKEGLAEAKNRMIAMGLPIDPNAKPKELWLKQVKARIPAGGTIADVEAAVAKTARYDVYRSKLGISNWWNTYENALMASGEFADFQKETGWKGNKWDFQQLEWDATIGGFLYERKGKKWKLYFQDSPKIPLYEEL